MNLFKKRKYTEWIPLGEFDFGGQQFVVMARGDKNSGELFFQSKQVNIRNGINRSCVHPIGSLGLDVKVQWDILCRTVNEQI